MRTFVPCCFLLAGIGWAGPVFFKPNIPDFYQHQKAGPLVNVPNDSDMNFNNPVPQPAVVPSYDLSPTWWEDGGGWCCVAAFVNSFYFLEKTDGYDGLFTRTGGEGKSWQELMIYAVEDMAKDYIIDGTRDLPQYVRKLEAQSAAKLQNEGKPAGAPLSYSEFEMSGSNVVERTADASGTLGSAMNVSGSFSNLFDVYLSELCPQ
jgi:hypothetical protein